MLRTLLGLTLTIAATSMFGCGSGEPTVWVTGKLLKAGAPFTPPTGQQLTIIFVATEVVTVDGKVVPSTEPYAASYDQPSGTFKVPGKEGSGIPPGKYRVAITSKLEREALNSAKPKQKPADREKDYLDDKFSVSTSPILREIKASTDLTIDLDKPTEGAPAS